MKEKIKIENENLANYIMFKLDKLENEFTKEELDKITEIVIDYKNETDSSFIFLEELKKLNKLQNITLRYGYIFNDNYNIFLRLENLNKITFDNCDFENADLISSLKLKSLSLINCNINDYSFINSLNDLELLSIINGKIEINKINGLNKLKHLQLSYSHISDINSFYMTSIEELYIDNTNINNLSFLINLTNLKRLSIDKNQYENNKELIDSLISNSVQVFYENMVAIGGGLQ